MISSRIKAVSFAQKVKNTENKFISFAKLILPPFIIFAAVQVSIFFKKISEKIKVISFSNDIQQGEISKQFHRRRFQQHLQALKLTQDDLGFTNQVIYQENKKSISYYVPVFVTNKIKCIQDVSVQTLTGNVSCSMIVNICCEGLPEQVIQKLENSITIQLNRGDAIKLEGDGITITVKRQKKSKFLIFNIRRLFLAFLHSDTLWSPFQLVELVISLTLNTVTIPAHSLDKIEQNSEYEPDKEYKISFNCMRNSDHIPISYALDCVFGVYDLAQRKLQVYSSRYGTLSQIQKNYEEYIAREKRSRREKNQTQKEDKDKKEEQKYQKKLPNSPQQVNIDDFSILQTLAQTTMKRLSLKPSSQKIKKPPPKVKYFQYTHFVVALYKYPGNSLATIFIPIFLLALVSLAIFFQEPQLSGRIGAIATMILGYIALIPSIKEQLPPSSKLTIIQSVVYIQTMCCLLCLYESFTIEDEENTFVWYQNFTFLLCLFTHISTFFFIVGVYVFHKLKWQPSYNCDEKVIQLRPSDNRSAWDNPFCDEVFIKFNKSIKTGKFTEAEREQLIVRPLKDRKHKKSSQKKPPKQFKHEKQEKHEKQQQPLNPSGMIFSSLLGQDKKVSSKKQQLKKQIEQQKQDVFFTPDPDLYYSSNKK